MKSCTKCQQSKPLDEFRVHCGHARGECRACERIKARERDPVKLAAAARKWSKNNPAKRNAAKRLWYAKNKDHQRVQVRRRTYGLTDSAYQAMLIEQRGSCAICQTPFEDLPRAVHIDHCHATGKVRGLLCRTCNLVIGFFKDDTERLLKAAIYLEKFKP